MAAKSDLRYCKNDQRTMRRFSRGTMKKILKAARRSMKRKVKLSLLKGQELDSTIRVNYIY